MIVNNSKLLIGQNYIATCIDTCSCIDSLKEDRELSSIDILLSGLICVMLRIHRQSTAAVCLSRS